MANKELEEGYYDKPIVVTNDIFISKSQPPPKGFSPTGYRYNLNNPIIRIFYERFKERYGFPNIYPLTDNQRKAFEDWIEKLITKGMIIVTYSFKK